MNKLAVAALLSTCLAVVPGAVLAQETTTVKFNLSVNQPTLFDEGDAVRDTFKGSVDDQSGVTSFEVVCSAGAKGTFGFGRKDETCAVTGEGIIRNPANPSQTIKRIAYSGGFVIEAKKDGYTNMGTINANYARVGSAPAENATFGGSVTMMPENPSAPAMELARRALDYLKEKAAGDAVEFDTQIDSIRFSDLTIPHVGQKGSTSCSWDKDAIFVYANEQWQVALDVSCGGTTYPLEGNVALADAPEGSEHDHEYQINLLLGGAQSGGDPFAAADPFATVNGITGILRMTDAGRVTEDDVAERIEVEGEIVGTGVPLEATRGLGQIMLVFARTFYGE